MSVRSSRIAITAFITIGVIGGTTWWTSRVPKQEVVDPGAHLDSRQSNSMQSPHDSASVELPASGNTAVVSQIPEKIPSSGAMSANSGGYNLKTLGSHTKLRDVFEAALKAIATNTNADAVSSALFASSVCFSFPETPPTKDQLIEMHGASENMGLIAEKVLDAHKKMYAVCNSANVSAYMDELGAALRSNHSAARHLKLSKVLRGADNNRDLAEYEQAMTVVLGNPMAYTAAFDAWLERRMPKILPESFTREQTAYVQDLLFEKMLGKVDGDSLRDLNRCNSINICKGAMKLSSAEQASATLVADNIEQSIRQQRWQQLMPKQ
jgi:hypothetical protein